MHAHECMYVKQAQEVTQVQDSEPSRAANSNASRQRQCIHKAAKTGNQVQANTRFKQLRAANTNKHNQFIQEGKT